MTYLLSDTLAHKHTSDNDRGLILYSSEQRGVWKSLLIIDVWLDAAAPWYQQVGYF